MNGLAIAGVSIGAGAVVSFWGWLAVQVVKTNAKVAELEQRMNSKDHQCDERLTSISALFSKVNEVAGNVEFIRGKLEKS